jgi:mono/diheme cytochrome c family protein
MSNMRKNLAFAAVAAVSVVSAGQAQETTIRLAEGPELALVRASCSGCHSLDYIPMNSPFLKRAQWEAEVQKMIKVMGAPIRADDVGPLVNYLSSHYGVD